MRPEAKSLPILPDQIPIETARDASDTPSSSSNGDPDMIDPSWVIVSRCYQFSIWLVVVSWIVPTRHQPAN